MPKNIVSTVHRAQGSERLVVIIDPVRPSAQFLKDDEGGRLLNVAISRTKARLFVILHPDHLSNPHIYKLRQLFKPEPADDFLGAIDIRTTTRTETPGLTLEEQFERELFARLGYHSRAEEQKYATEQVAYSPRFARLTWAVRERVIHEVNSMLDRKKLSPSVVSKKDDGHVRGQNGRKHRK